jgi:molybdenum cofactor synthesis domain-containing protein
MGTVKAVCISKVRGVRKICVDEAVLIENFGIEGDAHAGNWHRQVSLLADEKIQSFRAKGAKVDYGAFGENIVADGFDFCALPVGTLLNCGETLLQITQIGKECHNYCAIYNTMGDCIMPREGVFAQVLKGGGIKPGDEMTIVERSGKRPYQAAVITLSDRCSRGEREDLSGAVIKKRLWENGFKIAETLIIPDEKELLQQHLIRLSDQRQLDLILTTGGTGFAPRDVTPEATIEIASRIAPGIAEAMRVYSLKIMPQAMLSRAASVIRGKTLIINLPGSPKACNECLDCIMETLPHALDLLRNEVSDCGR